MGDIPAYTRHRLVGAKLVHSPVAIPEKPGWVRCVVYPTSGATGSSSMRAGRPETLDVLWEKYKSAPVVVSRVVEVVPADVAEREGGE